MPSQDVMQARQNRFRSEGNGMMTFFQRMDYLQHLRVTHLLHRSDADADTIQHALLAFRLVKFLRDTLVEDEHRAFLQQKKIQN